MFRSLLLVLALIVPSSVLILQLEAQEPGTLASAAPPAYPLAARAAGLEGSVLLQGIVGTDGKIRNLKVLKGPVELRQAAIDAVARWVYHPYTKSGHLIEVETTVTVNFKMGNKKQKAEAQAKAQAELAAQAAAATPSSTPPPDLRN